MAPNTLELWCVPTVAPEHVRLRFHHLLSPDEAARASRFKFPHLQSAFTIVRGSLRCLLAHHLGIAPSSIQFQYASKGKPYIPETDLQFNVSHSGPWALLALAKGCPVGVDVEQMRPVPEMESIAKRLFCPEEADELLSLPAEARLQAFFSCWTRKEAFLKALGDGLSAPLNSFRVTLIPGQPARLLRIPPPSTTSLENTSLENTSLENTSLENMWTLTDVSVAPGFVAALAYHDSLRPLQLNRQCDPAQLLP